MAGLHMSNCLMAPPQLAPKSFLRSNEAENKETKSQFKLNATKSGGFSLNQVFKKCEKCSGQRAIECPGCKGTGKNKKNGNIFERWKCYDCQGFGLKSCPMCGEGGLTPEQRGER
ncbi:hypothetical protein Leryth_013377 [Lithospermum erythrorhizon]|uniref:Uncharacterized protein n=1 Tax=Lithospermum erythrorhizon TaxID=34254 RepID=A0AAV3RF35_LITER|nr:hypothetical protein Leryth_013377 [Lithospermum erythrorhizon]